MAIESHNPRARKAKIVHDENLRTSYSHYSVDCQKYTFELIYVLIHFKFIFVYFAVVLVIPLYVSYAEKLILDYEYTAATVAKRFAFSAHVAGSIPAQNKLFFCKM